MGTEALNLQLWTMRWHPLFGNHCFFFLVFTVELCGVLMST
jgi:hypothetical protein